MADVLVGICLEDERRNRCRVIAQNITSDFRAKEFID
jgi:hypothetical protein